MPFILILTTLLSPLMIQAKNLDRKKSVELLKFADRARGQIGQGITWKVKVVSQENGSESEREFSVQVLGLNARVEAFSPPRDRGQTFLFNDRSLWFFKPGLGRPVPISSRQRLTGQAANGDIASTNYAKDYVPMKAEEGVIPETKEPAWILLLKAKSDQVTYDQIRFFISQKSKLGVHAEFLTASGEVFKVGTMKYSQSFKIKGQTVPFIQELMIRDAKNAQNFSRLTYTDPKIAKLNPSSFNVNMLAR